jgi:hypothetical protein
MDVSPDRDQLPTYDVNPSVAHREIEGQILLLLPDDYEMLTLNETGRMVWVDLVEGRPLSRTARSIAERYAISVERALGDVRLLVDDLASRDVIRPRETPGGG